MTAPARTAQPRPYESAAPPPHRATSARECESNRPTRAVHFRTFALSHFRTWAWVAVLVGLSACGSARRSEPVVGPLELEDPVLIRGEQAFAIHCHQCHPRGEAGMGPSLNDKPLPTWLIRFQVRNGLGAMPAFNSDQLPPSDLDALLRYMKALRAHGR
jgi:cytochrome c5